MNVLRAGAIYAAANVLAAAAPFLLLPLLTRVLGPAEYGEVVTFMMLVALCMPFAGLSVHSAVGVAWFNRPRDELPAFVTMGLVIALATTVLTAMAAAGALYVWPNIAAGLPPVWGALAALVAGATILAQCRLVLWQSQGRPLPAATLQVASSVLNVGLSLVAVLALGLGGEGRNLGILLAACLAGTAAVALLISAGDARAELRPAQLREHLDFARPLIPHVLAGVLLVSVDRWMVSAHLGAESLGIYGAGAQLGMMMALVADAFVKAYAPWLNARLATRRATDGYIVVATIYLAMPMFALLAAAMGVGLTLFGGLLLGPRFAAALDVLPWFLAGGAFSGIYLCTSAIFFFEKRTDLLAAASVSAAILGGITTWVLLRRYGIAGAACGYMLTQALLALFTTLIAMRTFDLPWGGAAYGLMVLRGMVTRPRATAA